MKMIVAIVKPNRFSDVRRALLDAGVENIIATHMIDCGSQSPYTDNILTSHFDTDNSKMVRIEVGVNDEYVKPTVEAIIKGAKSGQVGDGKIFVLDLPNCIRIRTGEEGFEAIA